MLIFVGLARLQDMLADTRAEISKCPIDFAHYFKKFVIFSLGLCASVIGVTSRFIQHTTLLFIIVDAQ